MKSSAALAMDGFTHVSSPPLSLTGSQGPLALSFMMDDDDSNGGSSAFGPGYPL